MTSPWDDLTPTQRQQIREAQARRKEALPGHIRKPIGQIGSVGITLTSMAPEARDCLDIAMERWREQKAGMTRQPTDEVYAFAYWLLRYSGLVVPARRVPEPPEEGR